MKNIYNAKERHNGTQHRLLENCGQLLKPWTDKVIEGILQRWMPTYRENPRVSAIVAGLVVVDSLLILHAFTGFVSGLRYAYIVAIWLSTRLGGRKAGMLLVLAVTALFFSLDRIMLGASYQTAIVAAFSRFASFTVLMLIFAQVEDALHRAQNMALRDSLTGAMNRSALHSHAEDLFNEAQKKDQNLAVVLFDCDNFKELNDKHGHLAGDTVLRTLAAVIEKETRQSDYIIRLGGDEFLLLIKDATTGVTKRIMDRIRSQFEYEMYQTGYEATFSVGYSQLTSQVNSLSQMIAEADSAMYQQKSHKKVSVH